MGMLDKIKGLVSGRERQVKQGIDKVSNVVESKAGKHASKVDAASRKAKDAVDKLSGDRTGPSTSASTPPSASTPTTPAEPSPTTPPTTPPPTSTS